MAIYADVLIAVNLIVDYFLLLATSRLTKSDTPFWRMLLSAGVAALSSLTIFLPRLSTFLEILLRISLCCLITFIGFGFGSYKKFLRNSAMFFAVSFGFAGGMMALWFVLKPQGMVIHNSVVYFDISPIFLIGFSLVGYVISSILRNLLSKNGSEENYCEITLFYKENSLEITALIDSGNSIEDIFSSLAIIITEQSVADRILAFEEEQNLNRRYRAVPCCGATGTAVLNGYRIDSATVKWGTEVIKLHCPILAISKQSMGGDYSAIINPKILG